MTNRDHAKAVHHADQENARVRDERRRSPDGMTASERAMAESEGDMKRRVMHTPGPWEIVENSDGTITIETCEEDSVPIAQIIGQPAPEDEANARLMATSPELLSALRTLLFAARDGEVLPRDSAYEEAVAVIAKATGIA